MYAVERLGSYITRGVYTVSGPFHPFGGAIDIIVVEQQDGSFRSSPWNVRFGKFQGVLKTKEKVVNISVNGVEANFNMNLDHKGEAYFLRESDVEEEESLFYPSSSGEETDGQAIDRRPVKSKSCNSDSNQSSSVPEIDVSNGKIVRTSSRRSQILGLVFGRKSMKEDRLGDEDGVGFVRANSLERAEIAADLLEVKWSTNLASVRRRKDSASRLSGSNISNVGEDKNFEINDSLMENSTDHSVSCEETCSNDHEMSSSSPFGFQKSESCVDETGTEMQCLSTEDVTGTPSLSESRFEENDKWSSDMPKKIQGLCENNADSDEISKGIDSEISITNSQILDSSMLEACSSKNLEKEQVFTEEEASILNGCPSLVSSEISEISKVRHDGSGERAQESSGEEVRVDVETLRETDLLVAKEPLNVQDFLGERNCSSFLNDAKIVESEAIISTPVANIIVSETYTQVVSFDSINGTVEEVEPQSICTISGFSNSHCRVHDEGYTKDEDKEATEAINITPSEGSEEEQFLFGDPDDLKSTNQEEKEKFPYFEMQGIERSDSNYESFPTPDKSVQKNLPDDVADLREKFEVLSNAIDIPSSKVADAEVSRMAESLPIMWSHGDGLESLDAHDIHRSLGHSFDSRSKSSKWTLLRKDISSLIKSDADKQHSLSQVEPISGDDQIPGELKDVPSNPGVGDVSKAIDASGGSWRLWPFPFKRTRSVKATQAALTYTISSDSENALEGTSGIDGDKNVQKPKVNKKKLRAITPTSEQLASLNLKEGRNTVTFTFSTAMLGNQQVDARIYLWRWDTRIVISDVDGTITKSDVLGQFMPLVGRDWSQTGVAHLFSAIKENGYQLLFLSARAISQAYHTRQFLFNLKQDGKALPDGPVVISPDGLFPSLYREVIRRAPHEFKIACLEEIKALFPSDCNPFYAGFGNRHTDEFSYLKVGIPKGKIFIINPKGEVAVDRRIDTKSYTSLHALVHGMFPSMSSSEQEDFNSWNYWKIRPPAIDL